MLLRSFQRRLERRKLVQALLVLGGRIGVGDDPAPGLQVRAAVPSRTVRIAMQVSRPSPGAWYPTTPAYVPRR